MLHKFFGLRTLKHPSRRQVPPKRVPDPVEEGSSSALKIVHVGGIVESYYMAVPAARIMEKYPSFILARPDVFRRPWDSVVRPEEILIPGQKFFIVPHRTVKKLRRRIRKPNGENPTNNYCVSQSSTDVSAELVSQQKDDFSSDAGISSTNAIKIKGKSRARNRRVSFLGIDTKHDSDSSSMEKKGNVESNTKKSLTPESSERERTVRHGVTWHPALTVITESHGSVE